MIDFLGQVVDWFADPARWSGGNGIPNRLWEHVYVCVLAVAAAAAVALPPGVILGHLRRGGLLASAVVNLGRAVPSFGILVLAVPITLRLGLGAGSWPVFIALFFLSMPPIFTNAYTAVAGVDPAAIEAARGMGMKPREVLLRIELPMGAPVILAGLRVAAVQVVATATLGAVVAFGGLGRYIVSGRASAQHVPIFAGALLVVALVAVVEGLFALAGRTLLPAGVRRMGRIADVADTAPPA